MDRARRHYNFRLIENYLDPRVMRAHFTLKAGEFDIAGLLKDERVKKIEGAELTTRGINYPWNNSVNRAIEVQVCDTEEEAFEKQYRSFDIVCVSEEDRKSLWQDIECRFMYWND